MFLDVLCFCDCYSSTLVILTHPRNLAMFSNLCTIQTVHTSRILSPRREFVGMHSTDVSVVLKFGFTELEEQISWIEEVAMLR